MRKLQGELAGLMEEEKKSKKRIAQGFGGIGIWC